MHKFRRLQKRAKMRCKQLTAVLTDSFCKMREKEGVIQALEMRLDEAFAAKHELEKTRMRLVWLEQQLTDAYLERDALEVSFSDFLNVGFSESCEACPNEDCPNRDLRGLCILYICGKPGQYNRFRRLVEYNHGRFLYYHVGLSNGGIRLSSILPRADVVLCPLDSIDYDVVKQVKHFCERHDIQLVLLPRSSLSSFTLGLNEVVNL